MQIAQSRPRPWIVIGLLLWAGLSILRADPAVLYQEALAFTKDNSAQLPVSTSLLWVVDDQDTRNPTLVWRDDLDGEGNWYLQVGTWSVGSNWEGYVQGEAYAMNWGQSWLTLADQLQNFFYQEYPTGLTAAEAHLRVAQLLGMPGDSANDGFALLWVRPENLFRPTRQTTIDTTSANHVWATNLPSPDPQHLGHLRRLPEHS